jgi:hypothetical protein
LVRRILAAIVVGLLVTGFVVMRDADRSDARFTVVSGPPDPVIPTVMHAQPTRYDIVATPVRGTGYLYLQVGTYLRPPKDTIVLAVLDRSGTRIARCVFPPNSYTDNARLQCPLQDVSQARGLVVTRRGTARIALYAHLGEAGFLVKNEATSFPGRVSTVLSRVAVPLPNGVGSSVLLVGLFGSVALTVLALLLAVTAGSRRREEGGEPSDDSVRSDEGDGSEDRVTRAATD